MKLPIYQVDAFTSRLFGGNPAAVVLLKEPLPDSLMQAIAAENYLSETAFILLQPSATAQAGIRWFTPTTEVSLCGHATLAAAHVLFTMHPEYPTLTFQAARGVLEVQRLADNNLRMCFPEDLPQPWQPPAWLAEALGTSIVGSARGTDDVLVEVADASRLASLQPDLAALARLDARGLIITAGGGDKYDFVSRFFAPQSGIPEDPVTGSAHTLLTPFWAQRLQCPELHAGQLSSRGGELHCHWQSPHVLITGRAVTYLQGHITLPFPESPRTVM